VSTRVGLLQLVALALSFGLLACGGDTTVNGGPVFDVEVSCSNLVDDDGDGFVDCDDSDCRFDTACIPEVCDNGVDDDGDGLTDCDDLECRFLPVCTPETCNNGIDDDADFLVDCLDPECVGFPGCTTGTVAYELKNHQDVSFHSVNLSVQFDDDILGFIATGPIDILLRDSNGDGLADMDCLAIEPADLLDLVGGDGRPDTARVSCTHRDPLGEVSAPGHLYRFRFNWAGQRPAGCAQVELINVVYLDAAGVPLSGPDSATECFAQISP